MNRATAFTKDVKKWPTNTDRMITWLNKVKEFYGNKFPGEMTLFFHKNALHLLYDGKLKISLSIKNLVNIIG